MTDDKRHATGTTGTAAAGNAGRDIVGELVKAGGRRPTPSAADYERVLAAAREAWQQNVRTRRRRRRYFALAAAAAILAIGVPLAMQLLPTSQARGCARRPETASPSISPREDPCASMNRPN